MRDTWHRFKPVVDSMVGCGGYIRLLTLTVKNGPDMRERYEHLKASFRRLKQRACWKRHVQGAIRVVEITKSKVNGEWHWHYHVMIVGSWWDQAEISDEWLKATGDSDVVDIRAVVNIRHAGAGALRELFKYTIKDHTLTAAEIDRVACLLHGVPVVTVLGAFYRRQQRRVEPRPVACEICGGTRWFPWELMGMLSGNCHVLRI
jgi:hypothetical protein